MHDLLLMDNVRHDPIYLVVPVDPWQQKKLSFYTATHKHTLGLYILHVNSTARPVEIL